jgi:ABC-type sugar transport system permease subunit
VPGTRLLLFAAIHGMLTQEANKRLSYIFLVVPTLTLFLLFVILPIIYSFFLGMTDWSGYGAFNFIGLKNFGVLFADRVFYIALRNNIYFILASTFGQIPIGFFIAYLLHRRLVGGRVFFESMFFLPMVISTIVIAILWSNIFSPQIGALSVFLGRLLGRRNYVLPWMDNPAAAIFPICFVLVWKYAGFYMLIYLSALQKLPQEMIEAAAIDGARESQIFFRLIIPALWTTVQTTIVLSISGSMRAFDLVFAMTRGGPAHSTELLATYMYNKTFEVYRYGYGSAISTMIVVISVVLIGSSMWLTGIRGRTERAR